MQKIWWSCSKNLSRRPDTRRVGFHSVIELGCEDYCSVLLFITLTSFLEEICFDVNNSWQIRKVQHGETVPASPPAPAIISSPSPVPSPSPAVYILNTWRFVALALMDYAIDFVMGCDCWATTWIRRSRCSCCWNNISNIQYWWRIFSLAWGHMYMQGLHCWIMTILANAWVLYPWENY